MPDLSILIPARNEMFLARTIQDILSNIEGDTEVIAVLDGDWTVPGFEVDDHPRVTLLKYGKSIGQRAATNVAARLSDATFLMKVDAHCAFDKGFDVKLMADCEPDWTVIPRMYNLHAFSWVCEHCGAKPKRDHEPDGYQGPTPRLCPNEECAAKTVRDNLGVKFRRDMVWKPRQSRRTDFARFDSDLHFQYWGSYGERACAKSDIADVMSSVGACWFMRRARFWALDGMDEGHGSWGQFGTETACKAWLSGGRQVVNKKTWFAHMFRTQGDDFGFPYDLPGRQVDKARKYSQDLWRGNRWALQTRPLRAMLEHFWPVPDWTQEQFDALPQTLASPEAARRAVVAVAARQDVAVEAAVPTQPTPLALRPADHRVASRRSRSRGDRLSKGILYYTCNTHDLTIEEAARTNLLRCRNGHEQLVAVSLQPIAFGDENIVLPLQRCAVSMHEQVLAGLERMTTDLVYLVESDVIYHRTHFDFVPPDPNVFWYNEHTYKVDASSGQAVFYYTKQVSGCCAHRELLLEHYRTRLARIRAEGKFDLGIGYEPGCHQFPRGIDDKTAARWMSPFPNVDIRHDKNITKTRWDPAAFRNQRSCQGWRLVDEIPGWGRTKDRFWEFLAEAVPA